MKCKRVDDIAYVPVGGGLGLGGGGVQQKG